MSKSATMKSGASVRKVAQHTAGKGPWAGNTKWIIIAGALALVVGGLIFVARPGPASNTPATAVSQQAGSPGSVGRLTALRTKFNFGTISMASGKVTHRYPISNTGTEPISINKLYTSCMCTTAALVMNGKVSDAYGMPGHTPIPTIDVPLSSRDAASIEVVFDPAAHGPAGVGPIERVVTVENSAGRPLELQFSALVTP